jgi:hypothetical protein
LDRERKKNATKVNFHFEISCHGSAACPLTLEIWLLAFGIWRFDPLEFARLARYDDALE